MTYPVRFPVKVLQFGEGNFLRCFTDWMIDIMNKRNLFQGSISIVQPIQEGKIELLKSQHGQYNVFLRGIKNGKPIVERYHIDSITNFIDPFKDFSDLLREMENNDLRFIISNTTEAGITFDQNDSFTSSPHVSFPGKLTVSLLHRFNKLGRSNANGLIFLPCELIDFNGRKLKECILKYIELWNLDNEFRIWIDERNVFCNTLVDRIVTGFPVDRIKEITEEIGYEDKLVTDGEYFHLWVIEGPKWVADEFPAQEAGLNVLFVDNIVPFRDRKVRILNGSHTIMTPVGLLSGIETVRECVEDGLMGKYIRDTIFEEIIPNISMPYNDMAEFAENTLQRFKNPYLKHYLKNIALNSISKFTARVLPSLINHYERTNTLPQKIVFSFTCLLLYYKGKYNGRDTILKDDEPIISFFAQQWKDLDNHDLSLDEFIDHILKNKNLWSFDLSLISGLHENVKMNFKLIEKQGITETLKSLLNK